jgi:hypothetical protein
MSAIEAWMQRVARHHEQSRLARATLGVTERDFWETVSPFFKADPRRTDDAEVNRLLQEVIPNPGNSLMFRPTVATNGNGCGHG